jgi:serine/threonine protein kinase
MARKTKVLVDTCVLLDDPEVLVRIRQQGGLPFLTGTVLEELDFNKAGKSVIGANARSIFREFNRAASVRMESLPHAEAIHAGDIVTQFSYMGGPVFLVARESFRTRSNNDGKIIELAKDYDMSLITRDNGMKVRADALGVKAFLWTGPDNPQQQTSGQPTTQGVRPFQVCKQPLDEVDVQVVVQSLPRAGETVLLGSGGSLKLLRAIKAGGEGVIYETERPHHVCKIYHNNRLTRLKQKKIELMVSRRIDRPGICWPVDLVKSTANEFVGYIMPMAHGETMQSAMFVKPKLEKTFPKWTRLDLVNVAGTFIDHVAFLHSHNVIIGDINPQNLLVTENSHEVWMVDTDSFQIEGFPCPVGTVNFTAAEIQGRNYSDFLRTVDHELFAVATMLFMILFPGKPPYSQQGGGSPAENIKSKNFPYRFYKSPDSNVLEVDGRDAPQGPWQYIWANLPNNFREAFFATFREDNRVSVDRWTRLLTGYRSRIQNGTCSNELFPMTFPIRDPVEAKCAKCASRYRASKGYLERLAGEGKDPWCPQCTNRFRVERLAWQSQWTTPVGPTNPPAAPHRPASRLAGMSNRPWVNSAPSRTHPQPNPPRFPQGKQPAGKSAPQQPATAGSIFKKLIRSLFG